MHSYWVGIAVEMDKAGDTSLRWVLEAALAGEVFAAGHAETGTDLPVLLSPCPAERVEGGYRLTGRKTSGSTGTASRWLRPPAHAPAPPAGPTLPHHIQEPSTPTGPAD